LKLLTGDTTPKKDISGGGWPSEKKRKRTDVLGKGSTYDSG